MTAALALIPQVVALIPTVKVGVQHLIEWVREIRTAAQQSGEWTPDLEMQFQAALTARVSDPAYQPDR